MHLAKTLNLPDDVYEELNDVAQELSKVTKKPITASMAVPLLTAVYHAYISNPCVRDTFWHSLASMDIVSPEEFESGSVTSSEK
jgi:hypothetical protein